MNLAPENVSGVGFSARRAMLCTLQSPLVYELNDSVANHSFPKVESLQEDQSISKRQTMSARSGLNLCADGKVAIT